MPYSNIFRLFAHKRVTNLLVQTRLFQEFVGGKILGLRSGMHHFAMRVGVGIFFGDEIKVLLCPLRVVGAEHERAIIDLGWIAPILAIHDGLHALLDESRLEIRVWSFLHKDFSGIVRV